jgi:hypothetical protein
MNRNAAIAGVRRGGGRWFGRWSSLAIAFLCVVWILAATIGLQVLSNRADFRPGGAGEQPTEMGMRVRIGAPGPTVPRTIARFVVVFGPPVLLAAVWFRARREGDPDQ